MKIKRVMNPFRDSQICLVCNKIVANYILFREDPRSSARERNPNKVFKMCQACESFIQSFHCVGFITNNV